MNWKLLIITLGAAAFLAAPANALTLTNVDETNYTVEVTISEGDVGDMQQYDLDVGQNLDITCNNGCFVKLSNGEQQQFTGNEFVTVKDGALVLSQ